MVICFTSFSSLGCTFLEWSFNWLAGHERYWSDHEGRWIKLIKNPIKVNNAHGHKKNHPFNVEEWIKMSEKFTALSAGTQPLTYYGCIVNGHLQQKCFDGISHLLKNKIKIILLNDSMGKFGVRYRHYTLANVNGQLKDLSLDQRQFRDQAIQKELLTIFFTSKDLESKLKSVGEMRDFLTWNMKYCKNVNNEHEDNLIRLSSPNFLLLDQRLLIMDGEAALRNIFTFLNLKIVEGRVASWLKVYKKWQKIMRPDVLLHENMSEIIKCIRDGVSHSLIPYELDTFREALIQYHLIKEYKDILLVKALNKFPENTIELTGYLRSKKLSTVA